MDARIVIGLQVRTLIDPRLAEPAMTPLSRIFYTWFHPEPVIMGADPLAVEAPERGRDPFEANQAPPTLIFLKPRDEAARTAPGFELREARLLSLFAYPLSGGFRR